ncbi:MAG: hypothetical protein QM760_00175 [Nibricoccus sp.]
MLVSYFLGVEVADAFALLRAELLEEELHLVVLTTKAEDEDGGGVGVIHQAGEDFLRVVEIVAEL